MTKPGSTRTKPTERGFTLLEVLVATLVMAIAVAGLMSAISSSLRNAGRLTEHDRAALLGRQKMDELLVATGLEKGVPFEGMWGPEVTGGADMGWTARLTPFELARGGRGAGAPFIERIELEVWWMVQGQRRSFRLEGFHRTTMTRADVDALGALGLSQTPGVVDAVGLPGAVSGPSPVPDQEVEP
jgi:general secretion pathway protein I